MNNQPPKEAVEEALLTLPDSFIYKIDVAHLSTQTIRRAWNIDEKGIPLVAILAAWKVFELGIPWEAIIGSWKVNEKGIIKSDFIPNPNYKNEK